MIEAAALLAVRKQGKRRREHEPREAADLESQDHHSARGAGHVVYEIEGETVRIRKQAPFDLSCLRSLQATLSEWESPDDAAAYDDL